MKKLRTVAIYARVSTAKEAQLYALENQKQYYDEIIQKRDDWILYKMYVDEGISGTSIKKREQFQQMIQDAEEKKFDLIVTREVSRFARNTVDTLIYTRKLKDLGVEVYFIEDNIWSLNDEDGELKLTIMATLAQNESKKISQRAKAGQHISFINGVPYGNGNILGYDRIGKEYVINQEQAKTVRKIYDLYLSGIGIRTISFQLEKLGYVTAAGKSKWYPSTISHVLKNPFYCGLQVYHKEYSADFLSQRRKKNKGEIEKIVVKGKHQPIVTEEEYQTVCKILGERKLPNGNGTRISSDVWLRKVVCECGRRFMRQSWHKYGDIIQWNYRCRSQFETGSITTRKKKGLSIDGICDIPWVTDWKLKAMVLKLFEHVWKHKEEIIQEAMASLRESMIESGLKSSSDRKKQIAAYEQQLDNLLELRIINAVTIEKYLQKKEKIELEIKKLKNETKNDIIDTEGRIKLMERRLDEIAQLFRDNFNECKTIPDEIIDVFVEKIVVHHDYVEWFLSCSPKPQKCIVLGNKRNHKVKIIN